MGDPDNESMVLSKGINFKELLNGGTEFQIDMSSFDAPRKNLDPLLYNQEEIMKEDFLDEGDIDLEEAFKRLELSAEQHKLSSPEYTTFNEFSTKMIDCLPSGDVKMLIIEEGDGPLVPYDAVVTIHYAAYWEKESIPFDGTADSPMKYGLGIGKLLPGLEVGLTMVKGPRARFYLLLTPKVTWGKMGVAPRIRSETALFVVNLLQVQNIGAVERFNSLPEEDKKNIEVILETVTASNLQAKDLFKKRKYNKALKCYHRSLNILQISHPENDEDLQKVKQLLSKVYMNLAVCYSNLNQPKKVLLMCDDLGRVTTTEHHAKCQFYYGKAFESLGDNQEALSYYKKAFKLEPKNNDIGSAMAQLDAKIQADATKEKYMWRNVFNNKVDDLKDFKGVDEEIQSYFRETCDELKSKPNYSKLELPNGLKTIEIKYIKCLIDQYEDLTLVEDNKGEMKTYSLLKKSKF